MKIMMGFFKGQLSNVIEWTEFREDMIFWKWNNSEIKKGSKLFIRPGQDAVFFNGGKIEGIFEDPGEYNIESQIVPFLSSLKGFKFGFNSGMRVELLFVNTKQFTVKWGTRNAINIPTQQLPGGMPIRANGTFTFKVSDYVSLIDQIVGVQDSYHVEDIKIRITSVLDQLLMKWITAEGKDMFNLSKNNIEIAGGIKEDLNMEMTKMGLTIDEFAIMSFTYPKEIQDMITKAASQSMIGDVNRYQQVEMTDGIASGRVKGGGAAADMTGMMMGMNIANQMMPNLNPNQQQSSEQPPKQEEQQESNQAESGSLPNFCPNCGEKTTGANFCPNCGHKLA